MKGKMVLLLILLGTAGLILLNAFGIPTGGRVFNEDTEEYESVRLFGVANIRQGLDLRGGVSILYEADIDNPTSADMNAAQALLRGRLDRRNYTEADVTQEGAGQIRVDIPGVDDPEAAVAEIGATARLVFLDEDWNELLTGANVSRAARMVTPDQGVVVSLDFDAEGTQLFAQATQNNIGRLIRIFMDDELISEANVTEAITGGSAVISGPGINMETALTLANQIEQGSLPFSLTDISVNRIGARLGADALRTSIIAGSIGLFLVLVFMAVFYRTMGLCADLALIIYVSLVLLIISGLGITVSLPGIAGLILSIGMATDANIVIFERIREEVAIGKTLRSAMRTGFKRALPAIVDSNVTTLIAGIVLFWLGTGPIMGFAQMLIIGILVSMFTCLVVTRIITTSLMDLGIVKDKHIISKKQKAALAKAEAEKKIEVESDFTPKPIVEKRRLYFGFSAAILAIGAAFIIFHATSGDGAFNLDVEFSGGTSFEIEMHEDFENSQIEEIVRRVTGESAPQVQRIMGVGTAADGIMIRTTQVDGEIRRQLMAEMMDEFQNLTPDDFTYSDVSPAVSEAMRQSAIMAVIVASFCMLIYISIRFRDFRTGASAVIAQLHDALVVLCVYAILRIPLNYAFIAVMLTTLGYSINATIIIFDRIRENRARMPKATPAVLINTSVTQTLRRTIFSTVSSFIAVFMLYIIGVATIRDFTLPIMVGLLFGAYSSVCLSGSTWFMMLRGKKDAA
ncbi:MAG: protein translocase subunit SecD [Defluviitaleaceae bacterium]|nr:protein translocase subunit SecD [Defluviitaleaceae bacterium]